MDVPVQNEFVEFRESAIHGTGGFARRFIPSDSKLVEYQGRRITKAESIRQCELENPYIFSFNDEWDLDGNVDWNPARLLNHSCEPNAEARLEDASIWIIALRSIQEGEEITFNYNYDLLDFREHPCRCGSKACVGYIVAEEFHPQLRAILGLDLKSNG